MELGNTVFSIIPCSKGKIMGKVIDITKTIKEICGENPEVVEIMKEIGFENITNPGMINTVGKFMTISKGASMKKIPMEKVIEAFNKHGYVIKEKE